MTTVRVPGPITSGRDFGNNLRDSGLPLCPRCERRGPFHLTGDVRESGEVVIDMLSCFCGARLRFHRGIRAMAEV